MTIAWDTVAWVIVVLAFYSIGKGVGRAKGREEASAVNVTIEINGETAGGFSVSDVKPGGRTWGVDHEHPENL